ncbi:MAG: hypothetical protein IJU23_11495 [Proteobacteria bacterium]|nr:hypothetical protein [Pseudomonadota bacterium]
MFRLGIKREYGIFACGVLFGTAGLKLLGSRDAKRGYAHVAAALLRAKDEVMKQVTAVRESYADVMADARDINAKRSQEEAVIVEDAADKA